MATYIKYQIINLKYFFTLCAILAMVSFSVFVVILKNGPKNRPSNRSY